MSWGGGKGTLGKWARKSMASLGALREKQQPQQHAAHQYEYGQGQGQGQESPPSERNEKGMLCNNNHFRLHCYTKHAAGRKCVARSTDKGAHRIAHGATLPPLHAGHAREDWRDIRHEEAMEQAQQPQKATGGSKAA